MKMMVDIHGIIDSDKPEDALGTLYQRLHDIVSKRVITLSKTNGEYIVTDRDTTKNDDGDYTKLRIEKKR